MDLLLPDRRSDQNRAGRQGSTDRFVFTITDRSTSQQIEDGRLESVVSTGKYLAVTAKAVQEHNGLWFNDESFVVSRRRT